MGEEDNAGEVAMHESWCADQVLQSREISRRCDALFTGKLIPTARID